MKSETERLYTLEQAALELARRECSVAGHRYLEMEANGVDGPLFVVCERCGKKWAVEADGK